MELQSAWCLTYLTIILNSASSAAVLVFYLSGVCTHIDTEGKLIKTRVRNILKSLEKTQYLINTLYVIASYYCYEKSAKYI